VLFYNSEVTVYAEEQLFAMLFWVYGRAADSGNDIDTVEYLILMTI
jgi:hypothetical protein